MAEDFNLWCHTDVLLGAVENEYKFHIVGSYDVCLNFYIQVGNIL